MYINTQPQPPEILLDVYVTWHFHVDIKLPGKVLNFHSALSCVGYAQVPYLAVSAACRESPLTRGKQRSGIETNGRRSFVFHLQFLIPVSLEKCLSLGLGQPLCILPRIHTHTQAHARTHTHLRTSLHVASQNRTSSCGHDQFCPWLSSFVYKMGADAELCKQIIRETQNSTRGQLGIEIRIIPSSLSKMSSEGNHFKQSLAHIFCDDTVIGHKDSGKWFFCMRIFLKFNRHQTCVLYKFPVMHDVSGLNDIPLKAFNKYFATQKNPKTTQKPANPSCTGHKSQKTPLLKQLTTQIFITQEHNLFTLSV